MRDDRAQTALDYAIGIGVFLVAVALAFTFAMNILAPTTDTKGHGNLVADRTATHLAVDELADERYVWNRTAVDAFFALSESDAVDRVPVDDDQWNATLEAGGNRWTVGPTPPDRSSIGTAWRVGTLDGNRADLRVRVW
jgi:hypothetical protein